MRNKYTIATLLFVVAAIVCVSIPASRQLAWIRDYGEAEPLVEIIWPMAHNMKRFAEERGRPPTNLDELSQFSPDENLETLRRYPHEFTATGSQRFFLRVNNRFSFVVDENYSPSWSQQER